MSTIDLKFTTVQQKNQLGFFWGRNVQDIMIGDKLRFDGDTFIVEDVELTRKQLPGGEAVGAKIKVADASICIWGDIQNAPQWFNEEAKVEWL